MCSTPFNLSSLFNDDSANYYKAKEFFYGRNDNKDEGKADGCHVWVSPEYRQFYYGQFLMNSLHSNGYYIIDQGDGQINFEGDFYNGDFEGYGKIIYKDSSHFQGLFLGHERFGPGVYTYPDKTQDVGFWLKSSLIRLCVIIATPHIPQLAKTSADWAKLLDFRHLVKLDEDVVDHAKNILTKLGANEAVLAQSGELYNPSCANNTSLSFNKPLFDETFYGVEDYTIDVVVSDDGDECNDDLLDDQHETVERDGNFNHRVASSGVFETITDEDMLTAKEKQTSESLFRPSKEDNIVDSGLADISKDDQSNDVPLFLPGKDRYTNLELQLNHLKLKLETMYDSRKVLVDQLRFCKDCCRIYSQKLQTPVNYSRSEVTYFTRKMSSRVTFQSDSLPDASDHIEDIFVDPGDKNVSSDIVGCNSELITHAEHRTVSEKLIISQERTQSNETQDTIDQIEEYLKNFEAEGEADYPCDACLCNFRNVSNVTELIRSIQEMLSKEKNLQNVIELTRETMIRELERRGNSYSSFKTKKIKVSEILAWNNEEIQKRILKHAFLNRRKEHLVNFDISNIFLNNRKEFDTAGNYEEACKHFLIHCNKGDNSEVVDYLQKLDINPNICDARGNCAALLASAADRIQVIKSLNNFGASLDTLNDEGLNALTLCLLRYLSLEYAVTNWSTGFLSSSKSTTTDNIIIDNKKWRFNSSVLSHSSIVVSSASASKVNKPKAKSKESFSEVMGFHPIGSLDGPTDIPYLDMLDAFSVGDVLNCDNATSDYILSTDYVPAPFQNLENKERNKKLIKINTPRDTTTSETLNKSPSLSRADKTSLVSKKSEYLNKRLGIIQITISFLLRCGADPNKSEVPLPAFALSLFTRQPNLVQELASYVDVNKKFTPDELSPLHIICSIPPDIRNTKICEILLQHDCDPNAKTKADHWKEQKLELLAKTTYDHQDNGKSPLHILCLREDFTLDNENSFSEMAKLLIHGGCDTMDLYLGHSPLSMAVFKGNKTLIRTLVKNGVDPYQFLGLDMGNALTIHFLKKYESIVSVEHVKDIIDTLLDCDINPFVEVYDFPNVFLFLEKEFEETAKSGLIQGKKDNKNKKTKKDEKYKTKSKKSSKASKKHETGKATRQMILLGHLKSSSRNILLRYYQGRILRILYILFEENIMDYEILIPLALFFTYTEALKILQLLFNSGVIEKERLNTTHCENIIEFIKNYGLKEDNSRKISSRNKQIGTTTDSTDSKNYNKKGNKKIKKVDRKIVRADHKEEAPEEKNVKELISATDFTKILHTVIRKSKKPELDEEYQKYMVCFHCFKTNLNNDLIKCPECGIVPFCSEKCNSESIKQHTGHNCKGLFYKQEKLKIDELKSNSEENLLLRSLGKLEILMLKIEIRQKRVLQRQLEEDQLQCLERKIKYCVNPLKRKVLLDEYKKLQKDYEKNKMNEEDFPILKFLSDKNSVSVSEKQSVLKDVQKMAEFNESVGLHCSREFESICKVTKADLKAPKKEEQNKIVKADQTTNKSSICGRLPDETNAETSLKFNIVPKYEATNTESNVHEVLDSIRTENETVNKKVNKLYIKEKKRASINKSNEESDKMLKKPDTTGENCGHIFKQSTLINKGKDEARKRINKPTPFCLKYSKEKKILSGSVGKIHHHARSDEHCCHILKSNRKLGDGKPIVKEEEMDITNKVLPQNCQCLLEELARLFPDLKLSGLFMPFACYDNGQIYYRFYDRDPNKFFKTYSKI